MAYTDLLRSDSVNLEIGDVLRASPAVLLSLGPGAVAGLQQLGIETVFDLARSATFAAADLVLAAGSDPSTPESRVGALPSDVLVPSAMASIAEAENLPVSSLRAVAAVDQNGALAETLGVTTVRDFALWPPYLAARSILDEATQNGAPATDDTPGDLLPMSGRYPTERAYYSSYILADVDPIGDMHGALEDAGPIDPLPAVTAPGFTRPVRGARLTFAQSWYSQGVALGQLLHSLALAPGESTRLAMIDWSRQQSATQSEQAGQTEQLMGDVSQKRAMSEVQGAVAREAQNGFSNTSASSTQMQGGVSTGFSLGPVTLGGSFSGSQATAQSATVTGSSGVRSISAAMTQNVADATHQAASSARNMFASVVRELSQSEHESLSTRVIANYNHMHAITVQYYEVVQVYRTVIGLHRFEPCLYVAMKLVDFTATNGSGVSAGDTVVRRYRAALQAAALDARTAALLAPDTLGVVEIQPSIQGYQTVTRGVTVDANGNQVPVIDREPMSGVVAPPLPPERASQFSSALTALRRQLGRDILTRSGDTLEAPDELRTQRHQCGLQLPAGTAAVRRRLHADRGGGSDPAVGGSVPGVVRPGAAVAAQLARSRHRHGHGVGRRDRSPSTCRTRGCPSRSRSPSPSGSEGNVHDGGDLHPSGRRKGPPPAPAGPAALLQPGGVAGHGLRDRGAAARWLHLPGPATRTDGRPVAARGHRQLPDLPDAMGGPRPPRPGPGAEPGHRRSATRPALVRLDAAGMPTTPRRRRTWFRCPAEECSRSPSSGVRTARRSWTSPGSGTGRTRQSHLQPPDIAALQSGSRAQADNTTPTGLAAPVVAFNNPPAIPDPAGIGAALGAVANGSMFRDMSGAATTQALAAAALASAGQGATGAGAQAAASAAAAAQKEIEMAKLAVSVLTGGAGGGDGKSVSEQGAKINEGRSMDERGVAAADGAGTGSHESQAAEGNAGKVLELIKSATSTAAAPAATGTPTATARRRRQAEARRAPRFLSRASPAASRRADARHGHKCSELPTGRGVNGFFPPKASGPEVPGFRSKVTVVGSLFPGRAGSDIGRRHALPVLRHLE